VLITLKERLNYIKNEKIESENNASKQGIKKTQFTLSFFG